MTCYKFVIDDREPVLIEHSKICYPPANENNIDQVDTSYPGIVLEFDKGYLLEDGVHRIAKLQKQGIFESLFYNKNPLFLVDKHGWYSDYEIFYQNKNVLILLKN